MRVVFMGTPDFAASSLQALYDSGFDVAGVFTQPDKPRGRGMEMSYSPVKELAITRGTPVFQPEKMRDGTALEAVRSLSRTFSRWWPTAAYCPTIYLECLNTGP